MLIGQENIQYSSKIIYFNLSEELIGQENIQYSSKIIYFNLF